MFREIIDKDSFQELRMSMKRNKRLLLSNDKSEPTNSVTVGICTIQNIKALIIFLDKSYKMGTMGIVEGEKITLAFEYATQKIAGYFHCCIWRSKST